MKVINAFIKFLYTPKVKFIYKIEILNKNVYTLRRGEF